ncbi:MAG: tRNA (guanosine(37)-N1)-methyltransferase TrmD [Patescibacteria group bacterium]|jgi:tRNA (guanine37-N1)-methyltransferase|nr:tRNA (guanosine(37)-N1)-methyltransferase TrmD [Patescibacteria group bacterium]
MKFNIITIFPNILNSYWQEGIIKKALEKKIIKIKAHNLRDFTTDKHQTVDDTVYGGGAGMLLKIEPLYRALKKIAPKKGQTKKKIILLSAQGKTWNQSLAKKYSQLDELTLICGRYEGVDERIKNFIDEEISIGDYILSGGELGAAVIIDSISRLMPGVLGNQESLEDESHNQSGLLEYPQYTKPAVFKKMTVPEVLLSGHHKAIEDWKKKNIKKKS